MKTKIHEVLLNIANQYPENMVAEQVRDIPRICYHIGLAQLATGGREYNELEISDIGGGVGLFSVGCAANGFKHTVLIDDFNDAVNKRVGGSVLDLHRKYGVEVVSCDVIRDGMKCAPGLFDVITSFDSMEHWHHSPKRLFQEVVERLKPNGAFILGVPNCVNMRKRLSLPFGVGKWSLMEDWYEAPEFRGHVREPDVEDLRYIARDMGLVNTRIVGRNWLGYYSPKPIIRVMAKVFDFPLRLRPSLCSDIYLVGNKPE